MQQVQACAWITAGVRVLLCRVSFMCAMLCRRPGYTKLMKNMNNVSVYLKKRIMDLGAAQCPQLSHSCRCAVTCGVRGVVGSLQPEPPLAVPLRLHCCRRPFQGAEPGRGPAAGCIFTDEEGRQAARLHRVSHTQLLYQTMVVHSAQTGRAASLQQCGAALSG